MKKISLFLAFLSAILLWCFALFIMHRYKIGSAFLKKCLNYFSRRACLHYVGNTFGTAICVAVGKINPRSIGVLVLLLT